MAALTQKEQNKQLIMAINELTKKVEEGFVKSNGKIEALNAAFLEESKVVALSLEKQHARLNTLEKYKEEEKERVKEAKKEKKELTLSKEARVIAWATLAISLFFVYHAIFMD